MQTQQISEKQPLFKSEQQPPSMQVAAATRGSAMPPVRSLDAIRQKQTKPLRTASPLILSDANVDWDTLYPQVTAAIMQGSCNPSISAVKSKFQLDYRSAKSLLDELVCKGYLLANHKGYQLNPVEPSVQRSHQMCGGIAYADQQVFFPNPSAALPVRLKGGETTWVSWGRRLQEASQLPNGGWARLESIRDGKWRKYAPRPVLIPAQRYMEKDPQGGSHWFPLEDNWAIQGLLAETEAEQRVYVVTVQPPQQYAHIHERWPRLVRKQEWVAA